MNHRTGTTYLRKEGSTSVTVTRNEGSAARSAAGDAACRPVAEEVCTEGPETRMVEGVAVTQSCWAWSRTFSCQRTTQASDCTDLDANRQCRLRDECLDDPQSGACKVSQRVYGCPLPDEQAPGDKQYICGGDVYCINGDCEPIEREASTEFKDTLVALHSLGDAGNQFDPDNLTVFKGERGACSRRSSAPPTAVRARVYRSSPRGCAARPIARSTRRTTRAVPQGRYLLLGQGARHLRDLA
ncbi:conjugal transfer protein TraN [Sphingomonas panni]